jgi:hypothetical protein
VKFNYRTVHITPMIWKYSVRHSLARIVRLRHGHRGISTLRHKSLHLKFRNQKIQSDTPLGTRHTASTSAQRSPATHARRGGGGGRPVLPSDWTAEAGIRERGPTGGHTASPRHRRRAGDEERRGCGPWGPFLVWTCWVFFSPGLTTKVNLLITGPVTY